MLRIDDIPQQVADDIHALRRDWDARLRIYPQNADRLDQYLKGECEMNADVMEKVRSKFVQASKEFNFTFVSPYPLDEDAGLYAFGFIDSYASKSGAIITLIEPPQYEADKDVIE